MLGPSETSLLSFFHDLVHISSFKEKKKKKTLGPRNKFSPGLGELGTDVLHDADGGQEGSQGDGRIEDAGSVQGHVDALEQRPKPLGKVPQWLGDNMTWHKIRHFGEKKGGKHSETREANTDMFAISNFAQHRFIFALQVTSHRLRYQEQVLQTWRCQVGARSQHGGIVPGWHDCKLNQSPTKPITYETNHLHKFWCFQSLQVLDYVGCSLSNWHSKPLS